MVRKMIRCRVLAIKKAMSFPMFRVALTELERKKRIALGGTAPTSKDGPKVRALYPGENFQDGCLEPAHVEVILGDGGLLVPERSAQVISLSQGST